MKQLAFGLLLATTMQQCQQDIGAELGLGTQAVANNPYAAAPIQEQCQVVDPEATLSREQLSRLIYVAEGNSTDAMRNLAGFPYCFIGTVEYFPLDTDRETWIGIQYNAAGTYQSYTFSTRNN
ncbi:MULTISPECIES: hypothetical protein [Trichocoleus]|uniref:Uncharacterized protein n=1 Tax=Trichocoleus desertorum GB2-A4 TaxID=2933944 RepID=A0ABV0JEV2_9CYAN|nr:hypothetical protein [Trichocoleus sp. FACHB-46]MBD1865138.1 hypothetical protein [Trichocoleus sp. FACHB-46]